MPASSPAIRHWAAKSGGLIRDRAPDDPERVEAETELATHRIADHVSLIYQQIASGRDAEVAEALSRLAEPHTS
jgi:hypothetical protein